MKQADFTIWKMNGVFLFYVLSLSRSLMAGNQIEGLDTRKFVAFYPRVLIVITPLFQLQLEYILRSVCFIFRRRTRVLID